MMQRHKMVIIKILFLYFFQFFGVSNSTVTPVWSENNVPPNVAEQLSKVGINSVANWSRSRSNRDRDIRQIFNDGFGHFTYIIAFDNFFDSTCRTYTSKCFHLDRLKLKFKSVKQQMNNILKDHPKAVFVISLKPSYSIFYKSADGKNQTYWHKAFESNKEAREEFYNIWTEISKSLEDVSSNNLVFNVLNEPEFENYQGWSFNVRGVWEEWATKIVDRIRDVSPKRTIIIEGIYKSGYARGNSKESNGMDFGKRKYSGPSSLITPIKRSNIIYGFHFYDPVGWAHQSSPGYDNGRFRQYSGVPLPSMSRLKSDLYELVEYADDYNVPTIMSEIGVFGICDNKGPNPKDRATYAATAYDTLVKNGVGITWWALEDPSSPYARTDGNCWDKSHKELIPEKHIFEALRLKDSTHRLKFKEKNHVNWNGNSILELRGNFGKFRKPSHDNSYGYKFTKRNVVASPPGEYIEIFQIKSRDCEASDLYTDCDEDSERVGLKEKNKFYKNESEYWYGWSLYFPDKYLVISPAYTVHSRFKSEDLRWDFGTGSKEKDYRLVVKFDNGKKINQSLIESKNLRAKWHKVEVNAKWSDTNQGFFKVWVNGIQKVDYSGPTMNNNSMNFRYGIARYKLARFENKFKKNTPAQKVYFSNVKRSDTRKGLSPQ